MSKPGLPRLEQRLRSNITGDVLFDRFNRGRYATDASFYQIMPSGVVVPRSTDEALRALAICREEGSKVTPRGGGTSQCGQTVNDGIVIDLSKHLNRIVSLDVENRSCVVEPGIVLDDLNRQLKQHGLWFPVDVSTASRATIGGMAGNNSCGGRSLRYRTMRDNTRSMEAALADGTVLRFGEVPRDLSHLNAGDVGRDLFADMLALGRESAMFKPIISTAVRGDPVAVLIVEFAEEDQADNIGRLKQLGELMTDLGFGWDQPQRKWGGVVEIAEPALQTGIAE